MSERDDFLLPRGRYHGEFTPEKLVFNSNLQEFAQRVNYICGLETNGKVTSEEAYQQIKHLWKKLRSSKKSLGIGKSSDEPPENS